MAEAALPCTQCVFAISTNSVARAVPPYCYAILAQSVRAQHASNTTARANSHTRLPSFKRLAITLRPHVEQRAPVKFPKVVIHEHQRRPVVARKRPQRRSQRRGPWHSFVVLASRFVVLAYQL